jgi:hypothetical protein
MWGFRSVMVRCGREHLQFENARIRIAQGLDLNALIPKTKNQKQIPANMGKKTKMLKYAQALCFSFRPIGSIGT